jgi:hypothetical protein
MRLLERGSSFSVRVGECSNRTNLGSFHPSHKRFFGFQRPVIDEPTSIDGFPDSLSLRLIGIETIPEGFEHTSSFSNGVFEVRDSSPAYWTCLLAILISSNQLVTSRSENDEESAVFDFVSSNAEITVNLDNGIDGCPCCSIDDGIPDLCSCDNGLL